MEYISKHEVYTMMKDLEAAYIYPPVKEAYATAARRIDQMPATDVQPVKRGKWNIKDNHFHSNIIMNYAECSCCGHTCSTTESTHNNYCPNCGADMRGDTNG